MMNRLLFALLVFLALPVLADHESAEKILGQFNEYPSRTHKLKPAQTLRKLPISTDTASYGMKSDVEALGKDVFSVLIIENGAVITENYANGAAANTPLNLYSATKSLTALAVGEALCAGKIKSLEDLASTYAPVLEGTAYGAASIRNLLGYTSGAKDPGGSGFSGIHNNGDFAAMMRQSMLLADLLKKHGEASPQYKAGEKFNYNGLNSEALSLVVRGATGAPLPQWFEATVWQKAGAESAASWFTDRDDNGVAEALVWITTRDFARIGLYVLERLTNKTADSCMNAFVQEAALPRIDKGSYWRLPAPSYGLGMHIGADKTVWFQGHGTQVLAINQKTGRILAINGFREWRGMATDVLRLFNR